MANAIVDMPLKDITVSDEDKATLAENASEAEEKITAITGHLLMANFATAHYHCHIYITDKDYINCTFNEDVANDINGAIRHYINAIGIATIKPTTNKITAFHIKQITLLDNENISSDHLLELLNTYIKEHNTLASFNKSWQQATTQQLTPVSKLWDGIDASH